MLMILLSDKFEENSKCFELVGNLCLKKATTLKCGDENDTSKILGLNSIVHNNLTKIELLCDS